MSTAAKNSMRVLVIGAGYAGATIVVRLASRSRGRVAVTVVNPRPAFVNRLRLHHVAMGRRVAAPGPHDAALAWPRHDVWSSRTPRPGIHAAGMTVLAIPDATTVLDFTALALADHQAVDAHIATRTLLAPARPGSST